MAREERGGRYGGSEGQERRVSAGGLQEHATGEEGAVGAEVQIYLFCFHFWPVLTKIRYMGSTKGNTRKLFRLSFFV